MDCGVKHEIRDSSDGEKTKLVDSILHSRHITRHKLISEYKAGEYKVGEYKDVEYYLPPSFSTKVAAGGGESPQKYIDSQWKAFSYPLRVYIRHHWMLHVRALEETPAIIDKRLTSLLKSFLGTPDKSSKYYRAWYVEVARACGTCSEGGWHEYASGTARDSEHNISRRAYNVITVTSFFS